MAYIEEGDGPPVLLLHGNPTSSFIWRDVMPPISAGGYRCVAPDLVGMGDSDGLPVAGAGSYRFRDHAERLDGFIEELVGGEPLRLVVHDWGSALGFNWARRNPARVRGIAYMEAIVMPLTWDQWPEAARGIFQAFRSPKGEELILDRNAFVERVLPASVLRPLSDEVMAEYRRPFAEAGESRRPTLSWPREIPLDGEPADVTAIVSGYADWLRTSEVPKLFVNGDPGSILVGEQREFCRSWPNQDEVTVPGVHFLQEDSGREVGAAIAGWLRRIDA
jgi:haloalkane dehalogenase